MVGSALWGVEKFKAKVTLKLNGSIPTKVIACDEHGYPTDKPVRTVGPPSAFTITLDDSSSYHVIQR